MTELITPDLVALDADLGTSTRDVIAALVARIAAAGRSSDPDGLLADAMAREGQAATGLPGGIGIPHCRSESVSQASLGFARLSPKVDFGAPDGPADLVFLIAAPAGADQTHLTLLTALARSLVRPEFVASLRAAGTPQEIVELVDTAVNPAPAATRSATTGAASAAGASSVAPPAATSTPTMTKPSVQSGPVLVAITACPTGIAHTYMAADSLSMAAQRAGVTLHVETQGSTGASPLDPSIVSSADAVIFATDVGVRDRGRFAGKPVIASGVKRAINEPDTMIAEAVAAASDPDAARVQGAAGGAASAAGAARGGGDVHWGLKLRQYLLTGVSYMIPFVAAGGLLIALGFLFAGYRVTDVADYILGNFSITNLPSIDALRAVTDDSGNAMFTQEAMSNISGNGLLLFLGAAMFKLGGLAFGFLVPALAGYIAYAIADRPGIAPGFTLGAVASFAGAGFLGGIVGGLIAGLLALFISRLGVPRWARGLMPVVVIPLFATLITGLAFFVLLARPLAAINTGLSDFLNGLTGTSAIVLGIILGLMMAFDLGGPVNKAAYTFATAGLAANTDASFKVMAAVMAAGMAPPIGLAMATAVRRRLFSEAEQENGKASWLLGASFISEGAIPFAAADPLRVIPPAMIGSAVTGAIIMASGVTLRAPHGGIFVFFAMGNPVMFFVATAIGAAITAALVIVLKQTAKTSDAELAPAA